MSRARVVIIVFFIAVMAIGAYYALVPLPPSPHGAKSSTYPSLFERPYRGFYMGEPIPKGRVYIMWKHPQWDLQPLRAGETLRTNTLKLYVLAGDRRTVHVILHGWRERIVGNKTEIYDRITVSRNVTTLPWQFSIVTIKLPTDRDLRYFSLEVDGRRVLNFTHQTFPAWVTAGVLTQADLASVGVKHMLITALVAVLVLLLTKLLYDRVGYLPPLPRSMVALAPLLVVLGLGYGFFVLIYYLTETALYEIYPVLAVGLFLVYIYMLYRPPELLLAIKERGSDVEIHAVPVISRSQLYLAPGWKDLILGRLKRIVFSRPHSNLLRSELFDRETNRTFDAYLGYIESLEEREDEIQVDLLPKLVFEKKKAWLEEKLKLEDLTAALAKLEEDYTGLQVRVHEKTVDSVRAVLKRLADLLTIKEEKRAWEKEREKR